MFVVVKTHSPSLTNIGDNGSAIICDSYEEAVACLCREYNEYLAEEIANNSILDEESCYLRDDVAQVKWDDGEWTRFTIIDDINITTPTTIISGSCECEYECCGNCLYSRRIEDVTDKIVCVYDKTPMIESVSQKGCSLIWKPIDE